MTLRVHRVHHSGLKHFLQGGILGGMILGNNAGYYLDAKTLNFTAPAGAVVFAAAHPTAPLTPLEIKAQIEAAIAALRVTFPGGSIGINLAAPAVGVVLANTGTANTTLGFGSAVPTTGVFYNPPGGGAPELVSVNQIGDGYLQVITEE